MSYSVLYRKFRPQVFAEVKGQDAIVTTLKNQVKTGRIGHAYLFCGTRGTGKTTIAKIFARAVNCENPQDGEPCGECEACRAILSGISMDVVEMDAASNNGVEDIRKIREEVAYTPAQMKYKVYIVDEVHMLSTSASNALLKTLEEPPSYVIFILATTDPQKLPLTILSRCQRYNFRRVGQETIMDRLKELAGYEQVEADDEALRYIARKGEGSMRDAISLLDQCIAFYFGERLTYDRVLEVLGAVDSDVYSRMLQCILKKDVAGTIGALEQLIRTGADLTQFVQDFTWYLRNLMLLKADDNMEDILDVSSENLKILTEEAGQIRQDTVMRFIRLLSELSDTIRYATNRRVLVEMALIRMCRPQMQRDESALLERIRALEEKVQDGVITAAPAQGAGAFARTAGSAGFMPGEEAGDEVSAGAGGNYQVAAPEDLQHVKEKWSQIVRDTSGPFQQNLKKAAIRFKRDNPQDGRLYVMFPDFLADRYTYREDLKQELEQVIQDKIGKKVEVKFVIAKDVAEQRVQLGKIELSQLQERVNMPIEIDDEDPVDFQ